MQLVASSEFDGSSVVTQLCMFFFTRKPILEYMVASDSALRYLPLFILFFALCVPSPPCVIRPLVSAHFLWVALCLFLLHIASLCR